MAVVVIREDPKHMMEMLSIEDEEPVETLRTNRPHESLGHAVGLRRAKRGTNDRDSLAAKHLIKRGREFLVPIANQEPNRLRPLRQRACHLPRLLDNPRRSDWPCIPRHVRGDCPAR